MKENAKKNLIGGICLLAAFAVWTVLIQHVDVRCIGPEGSRVGFATLNGWFHRLTGVHMPLYTVTDWLGLVPIFICFCFGLMGLVQWIRRRQITQVDADIILLGIYYIAVIFGYLFFESVPINYRPVLIDGILEASYPSSTTLLVLSVMPTLRYQTDRRAHSPFIRRLSAVFSVGFSAFMVLGRLLAGVHWLTDIVGSVLLSGGLFCIYISAAEYRKRRRAKEDDHGI